MEGIQDRIARRSYEAWLQRRDETINDVGFVALSIFSAGMLEPGTPDGETIDKGDKGPVVEPRQKRLASTSLQLLRVKNPAEVNIYTDEDILGHAA